MLELAVLWIWAVGGQLDGQGAAAAVAAHLQGVAGEHDDRRPDGLGPALAEHSVTDLGRGREPLDRGIPDHGAAGDVVDHEDAVAFAGDGEERLAALLLAHAP